LDLNLFNNRKNNNEKSLVNIFIKELKNALKKNGDENKSMDKENNVLEEYNLYEARKIFLDNKSIKGNILAWVMDDKSVCVSEHGDGGPYFISEIDLPKNAKIGEVYEKIDGKYVYNAEVTEEINKIE